jgi:hypothetical protein
MGVVARGLARRPAAAPPPTVRSAAQGWAATLAAVCGAGLVVGIPSRLVPDAVEPAVGALLLALAVRHAFRARRAS